MDLNIKVSDLKEILKKNRNEHHSLYLEAVEEYNKICLEKLEAHVKELKSSKAKGKGFLFQLTWGLPVPEEHLSDYDRVIRTLELTVDEVITLDEGEVRQYIMNEWGWMRSFASNTTLYSNIGSAKAK